MNSSLKSSLDITTNYSVEVCVLYRPDLTTFISVDYRYEIVDLFEEFYKRHHPDNVFDEDEIVSTVITTKYETYKFIVEKELIKICEPVNRKLALDVAENYDFSIPKNVKPVINRGGLPDGFDWN
ncbi:MAG: hypothetical protein MJ211_15890 [Bacteroidales bacterium]|nr:hypothetical protein [Bacteroidales bacterium]